MRAARRQTACAGSSLHSPRRALAQEAAKPLEFKTEVGGRLRRRVRDPGRPAARRPAAPRRSSSSTTACRSSSSCSPPSRARSAAVLVFDTSSSMAGDRLVALRAAGEAFLDGLRPADEAGLVAFNEDVVWLARRPPTRPRCGRRCRACAPRCDVGLRRTLRRHHALGGRAARADRAVHGRRGQYELARGGRPAHGRRALERALPRGRLAPAACARRAAQDPAASRIATGARAPRDRRSRGRSLLAGGLARAAATGVQTIADAMGHRYVLRYEPTGVAREGWHRIDARLRGVKGDVHVRRGYWLARQ